MQEHRVEICDDIVDLEVQGQVEINPFARTVKRVVAELPVLELGVVAASGVHVAGHVEGEIVSAGLWDHFCRPESISFLRSTRLILVCHLCASGSRHRKRRQGLAPRAGCIFWGSESSQPGQLINPTSAGLGNRRSPSS